MAELFITISVGVVMISIWAIYYFIGRIIYTLRDRWDDEKNRKLIEQARSAGTPPLEEIYPPLKNYPTKRS